MRMPPPDRVLPAPPALAPPMFVAGLAVTFLMLLAPGRVSAQTVPKPAAPVPADAVPADAGGRAVVEIERLDALRSTLAATFAQTGAPADKPAFNTVCALWVARSKSPRRPAAGRFGRSR